MKRLIAAALIVGLAAPALAEERPIGTGQNLTPSRSGTAVVLVDSQTGLPAAITTTSTAFAPSGNTVTLSASTVSSSVSFGSATTVAVSNTGANTVYIVFGTTSPTATTSGYPVLAGQTIFFAAGSNTWIAGITSLSTSTLLITPGSGVPAIAGGGSSGGGGGAITAASGSYASGSISAGAYAASSIGAGAIASGAVASGAYAAGSIGSGAIASGAISSGAFAAGSISSGAAVSGAFADGSIVGIGSVGDAAWSGSGSGSLISIMKAISNGTALSSTLPIYGAVTTTAPTYTNATNQPFSLDTAGNLRTTTTLSASSSIIGKVGIDQTTPGTTNLVAAGQNGTWTVQPGNTANTTPWLVKVSDGTNAPAVKAASTAAATGDPSFVVALSPNSPLPAGTATIGSVKVTDGTSTATFKAASTSALATDPALVVALSPNNIPAANASAFLNDAVATPLQIVALSGSTKIYVSAYSIVAAVAENVKFQYGTGSNCGTGTTDITANMAFSANGGISAGSGMAPLFVVPAGNALCVTASTTGPTAVNVSYAQF